jgi:hypothetical protein
VKIGRSSRLSEDSLSLSLSLRVLIELFTRVENIFELKISHSDRSGPVSKAERILGTELSSLRTEENCVFFCEVLIVLSLESKN